MEARNLEPHQSRGREQARAAGAKGRGNQRWCERSEGRGARSGNAGGRVSLGKTPTGATWTATTVQRGQAGRPPELRRQRGKGMRGFAAHNSNGQVRVDRSSGGGGGSRGGGGGGGDGMGRRQGREAERRRVEENRCSRLVVSETLRCCAGAVGAHGPPSSALGTAGGNSDGLATWWGGRWRGGTASGRSSIALTNASHDV